MSNEQVKRTIGPNMKKLICVKMSKDAIPDGGGLDAGIKFLTTPGALSFGFNAASKWADAAILAVRQAAEPNPWKSSTEEEIAGELLRKINERRPR